MKSALKKKPLMKKLFTLFTFVALAATAWADGTITMPNGLRIYVDDTFKTGSILSSDVTGDLVIPATVTNNGNEYKITDIDS